MIYACIVLEFRDAVHVSSSVQRSLSQFLLHLTLNCVWMRSLTYWCLILSGDTEVGLIPQRCAFRVRMYYRNRNMLGGGGRHNNLWLWLAVMKCIWTLTGVLILLTLIAHDRKHNSKTNMIVHSFIRLYRSSSSFALSRMKVYQDITAYLCHIWQEF